MTGTIAWAHRLFVPDNYKNKEFYSVTIYPDAASQEAIKQAKLLVRKKEDGSYQFRREPVQTFPNGTTREFGPPYVIDSEGNEITDRIGNGTLAQVIIETFNTKIEPGKQGSRLEGVVVLDLVAPPEQTSDSPPPTPEPEQKPVVSTKTPAWIKGKAKT